MLGNVAPLWVELAGGDEAGRGRHPHLHPALRRRARRPPHPRPGQLRHRRRRARRALPEIRRLDRRRGGRRARRLAGLRRRGDRPHGLHPRRRRPTRPTRCCSTSPPAPPRGRSSCCTPTSPTPSATSRPSTGWASSPATVHLNISSPGWAKHAWSCVFAPWLAEASAVVLNQARFDAAGALEILKRQAVTTFCAPPTVWRLMIQQDLGRRAAGAPRADRRRRAAESRGDRAGRGRLGPDHPRRLRPDRDHRPGRQHARPADHARRHGPPPARLPHRARFDGEGDEGESACRSTTTARSA